MRVSISSQSSNHPVPLSTPLPEIVASIGIMLVSVDPTIVPWTIGQSSSLDACIANRPTMETTTIVEIMTAASSPDDNHQNPFQREFESEFIVTLVEV